MPSRRSRHLIALITLFAFLFSAVFPSAVAADGGEILFLEEGELPEDSGEIIPDTDPVQDPDEEPGENPNTTEILFLQNDAPDHSDDPDTPQVESPDPSDDPEGTSGDITLLQNADAETDTPADQGGEDSSSDNTGPDENAGTGEESEPAEPGSMTEEETGDHEPVSDSVDSAITMKKVTGIPGEDPEGFMNGDEIEAGIRFASGQELDELALTVRPVYLDLTAFHMPAFENAGETIYSVYKFFSVTWTDDENTRHTETAGMPLAENRSAAEGLRITGLDRDYSAFEGAHADAEAAFTGEFRIVFRNVNGLAGTIAAIGVINSPDMENASISVSCSYSKGTASDGENIGSAGFEYKEPEDPEEQITDGGETPGTDEDPPGEEETAVEGDDPAENEPGEEDPAEGEPTGEDPAEEEPDGETPSGEDPEEGETGEEPDGNEPGESVPEENEPGQEEPGSEEPGEEKPGEEEPEEPAVPEEPQILSFSGLEFIPDEIEGVPGNDLIWSLGNYVLADSPAGSAAANVRFTVKPVTADMQVRILFSGSVSSYKVVAVTSDGVATVLEQTGSDPTVVDFDSTLLPVPDEENTDSGSPKPGSLPEGTQFIWISADEPSSNFEAADFSLTIPLPDSFESFEYTADTVVSDSEGAEIASDSLTGRIIPGLPVVSVGFSASSAEAVTGDDISFSLNFTSETVTVYPVSVISICLPESFSPRLLNPGLWEGYEGQIEILTVDLKGQRTSVMTVDPGISAAVSLTGEPLSRIELVPLSPLTGEERLSGVSLTGSFTSAGDAYAYGQFSGVVTELYTHTETSSPVLVTVTDPPVTPPPATPEPTPTPTPTPEPTPTPTPEPAETPEPTEAPTAEPYNPVFPPSATTPEPTPTEVPLSVDTPSIYANASSIAYGDSGVFYFRNLAAGGMKSSYYYVLHLMIPAGVQVSSIDIPDFGTPVRVSLVYESGSADLGTYTNGETVSLTDRQGTNLRYIAFQIHGAESVSVSRDVSLMVKNISARDRVATLQVILSVRDAKTAVIEQHYDKYNIALAGPRTQEKDSTPAQTVQPEAVTVTANRKNLAPKTILPELLRPDPASAEAVPVPGNLETKPLLIASAGTASILQTPALPDSIKSFPQARLIHIRVLRSAAVRIRISSAYPLRLLRYFRGTLSPKG